MIAGEGPWGRFQARISPSHEQISVKDPKGRSQGRIPRDEHQGRFQGRVADTQAFAQ